MTKFEEDLNKKMDLKEVPMYFTQSGCSMTRKTYIETNWIFDNYGNYHSDEEFHELSEKLDDTNDALVIAQNSRDEFEREYKKLKFQLQQQALPVVPECVDIWIKKCQELNWMITDVLAPESWASDLAKDTENWLKESKENFNSLALAFITGKYEVEKPQLFYLKNKLTGSYLYYDEATKLYSDIVGNVEDFFGTKTKFTQTEIGSMQAGSYEKIEEEK